MRHAILPCLFLLGGCAPGLMPPPPLGSLAVAIRWPARQTQVIPLSTAVIRLRVLAGTRLLVERDLPRPATTELRPTTQAGLVLEATTSLTVEAAAYRHDPPLEGEAPLATGLATDVAIRPNERTAVTLALIAGHGPTLVGFAPTAGGAGVPVLLSGVFGGTGPFAWSVGDRVQLAAASGSQLATTVPIGARSGPVTVYVDGVSATCPGSFQVVTRLELAPASASVATGQSLQFSVPRGQDAAGLTVDLPAVTRWEVVRPGTALTGQETGVATIDAAGRLQALAAGQAWVRVWSGGVCATASVQVP